LTFVFYTQSCLYLVVVVVRLVVVPFLLAFRVVLAACVLPTRLVCFSPLYVDGVPFEFFGLVSFLLLFRLLLFLHLRLLQLVPLLDLVDLVVAASLVQIQALLVWFLVVV
jgi:hypothetical protein